MSYAAKARASAAARLAAIRASESSDKRAGDGVEEDYGNDAAGPSSSAKFKRGGVVSDVDGDMPKARMDRAARSNKAMKRAYGGPVMDDHDEPDGDEMPGPGAGMTEGEGKAKDKGKGKTIVNVIVAPQAGPQAGSAASGPPMVPPPALARPAPSLPAAAPPQMAVAPMMAKPPGLDAMPMPMRKHGGRVMHGGAGGAEGRLEKSGIKEKVR